MDNLVVIKTYFHKHEAEIAKGLLNDAGIEAFVSSDDAGGFRPHLTYSMNNNRVLIKKEDSKRAKEALKTLDVTLSEEDLNQIAEIAAQEKQPDVKEKPKKAKKDYSIGIPIFITVMFLIIYVLKEEHKEQYRYRAVPKNVICSKVTLKLREYDICREYYDNMKVRSAFHYLNGNLEETFATYYQSGQVRWKGAYVKNSLEGPFTDYYENGQLRTEGTYVKNKLEGVVTEYYKTGELMAIAMYKKGVIHGKYKSFYKSGKMKEDIEFRKGIRLDHKGKPFEGVDQTYYENGQLWERWNYERGS